MPIRVGQPSDVGGANRQSAAVPITETIDSAAASRARHNRCEPELHPSGRSFHPIVPAKARRDAASAPRRPAGRQQPRGLSGAAFRRGGQRFGFGVEFSADGGKYTLGDRGVPEAPAGRGRHVAPPGQRRGLGIEHHANRDSRRFEGRRHVQVQLHRGRPLVGWKTQGVARPEDAAREIAVASDEDAQFALPRLQSQSPGGNHRLHGTGDLGRGA